MPRETAKAGTYELLADEFHEHDDKGNITKIYTKGEAVKLSAEQAERLTTGPKPAFGEPGAAAEARASALQAEADRLKAEADEAKARAADAAKEAKAS